MKEFVKTFYANPRYSRLFEWGKLISVTGGGQIIVQLTALISGILIIRLLPTHEYALYTLVNTMLGTMTILSDGGIALGVMAQGGKVWQDRQKLGVVVVTGLDLRKKFALGSLLIAIPALLYLLIHHGASWLMSALIILSLIPAFFAALSDTVLEVTPKLRQDIVPLQKNQVAANLGRLILTAGSVFLFPWAYIAVLAGGLPRIWANVQLKKIVLEHADLAQLPNREVRKEILAFVRRIMPGAIYYSISGQITIWLISIFGSTASIAQLGALGRLATLLTILTTVFTTLVVPRFARLEEEKRLLLSRFLQIQLLLVILSILIVGFVKFFPNQVLWVLGNGYSNLHAEVILLSIGSCIAMVGGLTFSLSVARGLILPPVVNILGNILTQLALILILDLSTTKAVLTFSIVNATVAYIMLFSYFVFKILRTDKKL
jgi:O-antigen/teichoic acid export membrane protein